MPVGRRRSLIALAAMLAAAACGSPEPPPGDQMVLANFTLIDGTGAPPLSPASMVIDDGRITWTGPAADLPDFATAPPMDLGGTYVMPGLINLHGHVGNTVDLTQDMAFHTRESIEENLRTYASYGVTAVLSMGTDQDIVFPIRERQQTERPTVARLYSAGQGLMFDGGYGGLAGVNQPVATVAEAGAAVDEQAAKRVDVIKLWLDDELGTMPKMPEAISQAIIDAAHRHNIRALAHVFYLEDAQRLVAQGIDGFVHSVRDQPLDAATIEQMRQDGIWQVAPTLSREASMFAYGSPAPFLDDPFFTNGVSEAALTLLRSPERQQTVAAGEHFGRYPAFFEQAKANLKQLADAGVSYGFGTDSGPPGRFPGFFEHWELQLMVEAGLTPSQAIVAATSGAAEFLRADDLGTLEVSKWADLIVLEADPLADILNTRAIRAVYVAGQPVVPITSQATR